MSNRIAATDVRDELLAPLIVAADLDEVDAYLLDLAQKLDATEDQIPSPLPYLVKQLAIAKCCQIVARRKAGNNPRSFQGTDGDDAYGRKLKTYGALVAELEPQITYAAITSNTRPDRTDSAGGAIPMFRG